MIPAMWKDKGGGASECTLPLLLVLICLGSVHTSSEVTVTLNTRRALATLDERFLSFTVDPEELATRKYGPISLSMVYALSPAHLRIAGPSSNNYTLDGDHVSLNSHVFYAHAWRDFATFLNGSGVNVVLCLNVLHRLHNVWDSSRAVEIVNAIDKMGLHMDYQLGYENQEYLLELSSDEIAHNVIRLRSVLDSFYSARSSRIVGPDFTQFNPKLPEEIDFVKNFIAATNGKIDAITVHPSFSLEDDVTTAVTKALDVFNDSLFVKAGARRRPIWLAESELEPKEAGFRPTMNSLVALGTAAQSGAAVFLMRPQPFLPEYTTPDFWMAALHKALVGSVVLSARSSSAQLHTFAHCTKAASDSNPNNYDPGSVTLFGANPLATEAQLNIRGSPGKDEAAHIFVLTYDETNRQSYLNGKELTITSYGEFPIITPIEKELLGSYLGRNSPDNFIEIPKRSIFFIVLPENRAKLCMGRSNAYTTGYSSNSVRTVAKSLLSKLGGLKAPDNSMANSFDKPADNLNFMYPKSYATKTSTAPDGKEIKTKYVTFSENDWLSKFPEKIHKNTLFDDEFPKTSVLDMNKYNRYRRHKHSRPDDNSEEFNIDGIYNHDGVKSIKDDVEKSSEIQFEPSIESKGPRYEVQNKANEKIKNHDKVRDKSNNGEHESLEWNLENISDSVENGKNADVPLQSAEIDSMFHGDDHESLDDSELFPELEYPNKDKDITVHNKTDNAKTKQKILKTNIDPEIVEIAKELMTVEEHNGSKNKEIVSSEIMKHGENASDDEEDFINKEPRGNVTNEEKDEEPRKEINDSLDQEFKNTSHDETGTTQFEDETKIQTEDPLHDQNIYSLPQSDVSNQNATISAEIKEMRTGIDSAKDGGKKISDSFPMNKDVLPPEIKNGTEKIYDLKNSSIDQINLDLESLKNKTNLLGNIVQRGVENEVLLKPNNITEEYNSTIDKNESLSEKEMKIEITTLTPIKTQATTNIMKIPRKNKVKRDTRDAQTSFNPTLKENGDIGKRNKTKVEREIQNESTSTHGSDKLVFVPQISVFDSNFHRLGVLDNTDEKENKKAGHKEQNRVNNNVKNETVVGQLQKTEPTHLMENYTESIDKLVESNTTTSTSEDESGKNNTTDVHSTIEPELIDIHSENNFNSENVQAGSVRVSENRKRSPIYSNYFDFAESFLAPTTKGIKTLVNYPSYKNIIHHAASYPPYKINDKDIQHSSKSSVTSLLPKFKTSNESPKLQNPNFGIISIKTNNNETFNEIAKVNDIGKEIFNKSILEENENNSYKMQGTNKTEILQIDSPIINAIGSSNISNETTGNIYGTDTRNKTSTEAEKSEIQIIDLNEKINKTSKENVNIGSNSSNTLGIPAVNSHGHNAGNIKSFYKRNHGTFKTDYQNTLSKIIPDDEDEKRQDIENVRKVKASKRKIPKKQYYQDYENQYNEQEILDQSDYDNEDEEESKNSYDSAFHQNIDKIKKTKKYRNDQNRVKDKDIFEMMEQLAQLEDDISNYNRNHKKYGKKLYSSRVMKEDESNEYDESDDYDTQGEHNADEELFYKNLLLFKKNNVPMSKSTHDAEELKAMETNMTSINNMEDVPINRSTINSSIDQENLLKTIETKTNISDVKANNLLDELIDGSKSNSYDEKVQSKRILRNINNDNYNNLGINPKSKYYKLNSNREYIQLFPYVYNSTHNQLLDFNSNKQNEHLIVPNVSPTIDFNDPFFGTQNPAAYSTENNIQHENIDNVDSETVVNVSPNSLSMLTKKSPDQVHNFDSSFAQVHSVQNELNYNEGKDSENTLNKIEIKQPNLIETTNKEYGLPISKSENIPLPNFQDNVETDLFKHGYRSDTPFLYDFFMKQQSKDNDPLIVYPSVLPKESVKTDVDISKSYSKSSDYGNKGTANQYNTIENISKVKNKNNYDAFGKLQLISENENSEKEVNTIKSKQKEKKQDEGKTKEVDVIAEMQKAIFPNGINKETQEKKLNKKPKTLMEKIKAFKEKKEKLRKSKSKKEIGETKVEESSEDINESKESSNPEFYHLNKEKMAPHTIKNKTKISKIKKPEDNEYLKKEEEIIKQKEKQNKDDEIPIELLKLDHDLELEEIKRNNRGVLSSVAKKPETHNAIQVADKILGGVQNFMQKLDPLVGNRAESNHEEPKKKQPLKPKRKPFKPKKPLFKNNKLKDWKANIRRPQPFKAQKIFPTKYPRKTSSMPIFSKRNIYKNRFETNKNIMKRDLSKFEQNFIESNLRKRRHNVNIQQDENDHLLDEIYNDSDTQKENHRYTRHILPDFLAFDRYPDNAPVGPFNYEFQNKIKVNNKKEKSSRNEIRDYEVNENSDISNNANKKNILDYSDDGNEESLYDEVSENNPIEDSEDVLSLKNSKTAHSESNRDVSDGLFKEYLKMKNIYKRSKFVQDDMNNKKSIRNRRQVSFDIISPSFFEKYKTYVKDSMDIINSLASHINKNNTNENKISSIPNSGFNNLESPRTREEYDMLSTNFIPQKKRVNSLMKTKTRMSENDLVQYKYIKDLLGEEITNDLNGAEENRYKRSVEELDDNNYGNYIDNEIDDIDIQLLKTKEDKKFNYFKDFALNDRLKYHSGQKLIMNMTENFKDLMVHNDTTKPLTIIGSTFKVHDIIETLQSNSSTNISDKNLSFKNVDSHNQTIKSNKTNVPRETSINTPNDTQPASFILPHRKTKLVNISIPNTKSYRIMHSINMPRFKKNNFSDKNNIKNVVQYKNVIPKKKYKIYLKNVNRFKRAKRTINNKFLELNIQPLPTQHHSNSEKSSNLADYSKYSVLKNLINAPRKVFLKPTIGNPLERQLMYRSNFNENDILNMMPKNEYEDIIKHIIATSKLDTESAKGEKLDTSQEKMNDEVNLLEHIELLKNNNSKLIKDYNDYFDGLQIEEEVVPLSNNNEHIRKYKNVFDDALQNRNDILPRHLKDLNYLTELFNVPINKHVLKELLAKVQADQQNLFDGFKKAIISNSEGKTGSPAETFKGNIIDTIIINPLDQYLTKINQDLGNVINITSQTNKDLNDTNKILKDNSPSLLNDVVIEFEGDSFQKLPFHYETNAEIQKSKNPTENNENKTFVKEPILERVHQTSITELDNDALVSTEIQNDSKDSNTNTHHLNKNLLGYTKGVYATTQDIIQSFKKALGF